MKKAFTLIELLVVIAIIAILAAILFPVFAQAKTAAKKTSALSNQKQIATSMKLYTTDYDDVYPRNDGCVANSSLLAKHNDWDGVSDPNLKCQYNFSTGQGSFAWRMNHFSWPKWVYPYVKNTDLFFHPGRGINDALGASPFTNSHEWSDWGEITDNFALNVAVTGALNTGDGGAWGTTAATARLYRNSWVGGTDTALNNPAGTGLIFESVLSTSGIMPMGIANADYTNATVTAYPGVTREMLLNAFYGRTAACNSLTNPVGNEVTASVFAGGQVIGFADGHAKFMKIGQILAATPSAGELVTGWVPSATGCSFPSSTYKLGPTGTTTSQINLNINYPLWGLGQ